MNEQRYIVEQGKDQVVVFYVKDTRVPNGFNPIVVALCPRESHARLIAHVLNEAQKDKRP